MGGPCTSPTDPHSYDCTMSLHAWDMNPEVNPNSDTPLFFYDIKWSVNGGEPMPWIGYSFVIMPSTAGMQIGSNTITASVLFSNSARGVTIGSGETLSATFGVTFESGSAECD